MAAAAGRHQRSGQRCAAATFGAFLHRLAGRQRRPLLPCDCEHRLSLLLAAGTPVQPIRVIAQSVRVFELS